MNLLLLSAYTIFAIEERNIIYNIYGNEKVGIWVCNGVGDATIRNFPFRDAWPMPMDKYCI